MRFVEPLSQQSGDHVDGLLRAFFRAQMPHPWPKAPATASQILPFRRPSKVRGLTRSRLVLAASVALLLLGSLLLPRGFAPTCTPEQGIDALGTANRNILPDAPKHKKNEAKPAENHPRPGFAVDEGDLLPEMDGSGFSLPK
jgi:hypothetical protein